MRRVTQLLIAMVIGLSLVNLTGCEQFRNSLGNAVGCDNTVNFKVTYHGNPVSGACVNVSEVGTYYCTDNLGLTGEICTGSYARLSGTITYGDITRNYEVGVRVGSNSIELQL